MKTTQVVVKMWPEKINSAPSWPVSSVGRALHRYRRGQKGYLVSIETEEEWQFINREIQKRGTWNASAWHIGLKKKGKVWTWLSGETLNQFRNGEILSQVVTTKRRRYLRKEACFIVSLSLVEMPIFARRPEVRSHSNHKVKNLFMLSVRISSYGCTREVWRARVSALQTSQVHP